MSAKGEAAIYYAELGYEIFPCIPDGKVPITQHGVKDATQNPKQIETWWKKTPDANIGISTQGLYVIDVDGADNPWPEGKDLSPGAVSLTPRGGRHYWYKQPRGANWRNTASKLAKNVDTRANGGYVIVPPSEINGKTYKWAETYSLPAWDDLSASSDVPYPSSNGPKSLINGSEDVSIDQGGLIPAGQRNDALTSIAGTMRRIGMTQFEILDALNRVNTDRCNPSLSGKEVAKIATSVAQYDPDQVSVAVTEAYWEQDQFVPGPDDPGPMPERLMRIPGFISEVMDFTLQTAPYPNKIMAFGGALALQAFLAGRKVRDQGDVRTNLYLLGLAHTGAGKDEPRKVNKRILHLIGLSNCVGNHFASGEGLQDKLYTNPCMLFQTDEMDGMLQSINKAKDARHENIMSALLTLYSCSNSLFFMRCKAGEAEPGSIDQPCLVMFGTAIPNHYYKALSERMLTNGFFARMIILENAKRGEGQEPKILSLPERVVEIASWWSKFLPGHGNLENWFPTPAIVERTSGAKDILIEARKEVDVEYSIADDVNDSVGTAVWSRVNEQIRKLALIHSISVNYEKPVIDAEGSKWAKEFIIHQAKRMLFMAQAHVSENPFHAECLKVLQKLRVAKDQELSHSILLKRMKIDGPSFSKIMTTLAQQGDIVAQASGKRGGVYYKIRDSFDVSGISSQ